MDFFGAQDRARRRSRILLLAFVAAAATVVAVAHGVVVVLTRSFGAWLLEPALARIVAFGTLVAIVAGCLWRTKQLQRGGHVVAAMLGGREVNPEAATFEERRLCNVVEEMAIAAGVPVPRVFVLDDESGINAFAAGYSPGDAAIAVSRGALIRLTRDEIRAIVAHEVAHVLNGDMRLNTWLAGMLYGILMPGVVGRSLLAGRLGAAGRVSARAAPGLAIAGALLIVVGQLGMWLARAIQAAASRQRELLADAAAVQFTREPHALASALRKVGGLAFGSRITHPNAPELAHLFFAEGLAPPLFRIFATHPPLMERIRRIDPTFDGTFPNTPTPPQLRLVDLVQDDVDRGIARGERYGAGVVERLGAAALLDTIGDPTVEHLGRARHVLADLPAEVRAAAHDPVGAQALVLALLVAYDTPTAADQATSALCDPAVAGQFGALSRLVHALPRQARLPLLDLALPALRRLTPEQGRRFHQIALNVIRARGELRILDLAVIRALDRAVGRAARRQPAPYGGVHNFGPLRHDIEILLSAVARAGHTGYWQDEDVAAAAFASGCRSLPRALRLRLQPASATGVAVVDKALSAIERAAPALRKRVLEACIGAIAHDGMITFDEAELVRAVGEALDLPIPPAIEAAAPVG